MIDIDTERLLEKAFQDLGQLIEEMWIWGLNAKDPFGNFIPGHFSSESKIKLYNLKRAINNAIYERERKHIFSTFKG